jgi:hypothetical protein
MTSSRMASALLSYCVEMQRQSSQNLEIYLKFNEVFSVFREDFARLFQFCFAAAQGEKLPKMPVFQGFHGSFQSHFRISDCVGTGTADPLPLYFAKINARGGGGLRGTSPQRSDPPPRGPNFHASSRIGRKQESKSIPVFRILIFISGFDTVMAVA